MRGFDRCSECGKFLESYKIIEVPQQPPTTGFNRVLFLVANSNIYPTAEIKELYRPHKSYNDKTLA